MTEKAINNVQVEANSINEILQSARNQRAYEGMPLHLQYMIDEVHKELCSLDPNQRSQVVDSLKGTRKLSDGNSDPLGFIYQDNIYVSLDCKK